MNEILDKSKTEKYYNGKYDRPFKETMLNENNRDILKELLKNILDEDINEIEVKNIERNTGNLKIKRKYYDALLKTNIGKIGIEVNGYTNNYVRPRNMSYISDMYCHHTLVGEIYNEDNLIVQINLSHGLNKENKEWKNVSSRMYQVQDKQGNKYVKNLKIYEINMDYYLDIWYSDNETEIEKYKLIIMLVLDKEELEKLAKRDRMVRRYMESLNKLNSNPDFREYMTYEEDQRKIQNSLLAEGIEQGLKQGKTEDALNMLKENIDINIVSKYTGLSLEELEEINKNV